MRLYFVGYGSPESLLIRVKETGEIERYREERDREERDSKITATSEYVCFKG